jgi:hypothetical protein
MPSVGRKRDLQAQHLLERYPRDAQRGYRSEAISRGREDDMTPGTGVLAILLVLLASGAWTAPLLPALRDDQVRVRVERIACRGSLSR